LSFGININLLIAIPASAALILLAQPVTRLVYERGNFTSESTLLTAGTLACYSAGILGVGIRDICNRCFYAYKSKKIPFLMGTAALLCNVALNYLLYPIYGPSGIAASMAISSLLNGFGLLFLLHWNKKVIDWKKITACFWKVAVATAAMSAGLQLILNLLRIQAQTGKMFGLLMISMIAAGVGVYLLFLWLLRVEELHAVVGYFKKKLRRGSASS
jgi:putative peptidoglycan lipid II flippase